ncbi:reverse transcriptase [Elysia marginata]|uniref:Reverse transcriptase n=1 Tax=Elysia marginata TaxID=1093978 RepID=A0AAV4GGS9_9GAST|nr:reverse transcriptase [Elysia marginata]
MKSNLEEYKCRKVRLVTVLEDSDDSVLKTAQPPIKTGRKWKVAEAIDEAKKYLKMKKIIGQTQTDRKGLGSSSVKWWSKTEEGGAKKWRGRSNTASTQRKGLLDGCDDWEVSADLPEWGKHPNVIRRTTLRPDIVIHPPSTQLFIMVELTVPYESRMEQAHTYKEEKYLDLAKELEESRYRAKIIPIEIGARGFAGSSAYDLLSKLSISGNIRTKTLKLLAETKENSSRWIWSRIN